MPTMSDRDLKLDEQVLKIHDMLDAVDYYQLLGLDRRADLSRIRKAFYLVAGRYHPDRNRDAAPLVQKAMYNIFKRLNEAYRILCDPEKRKKYDIGLIRGKVRLEQSKRKAMEEQKPEDTIKSLDARKFYLQAKDEFESGNIMNADLHLKVAMARERGNSAIISLAKKIQAAKMKKK
jgi:DnaJ-class molecular chaperone